MRTSKKIIKTGAAILIFLCGAAFGSSIPEFKNFPALGSCTGNYVRFRAAPNTNSDILGRLNEFDRVIVTGQRIINNKKWFEIENPVSNNTAWIYGDYLIPEELEGRSELLGLLVRLNKDFGVTPEKARVIFGADVQIKAEFSSDPKKKFIKTFLTHNRFKAEYLNNNLTALDITGREINFGDFKIGDKTEKLIKTLGEPSERGGSAFQYKIDDAASFIFGVKDGVITHISYKVYYEI